MKKFLIGLLVALATLFMCLDINAQTPGPAPGTTPDIVNVLDSTPGVTIVLPAGLSERLTHPAAEIPKPTETAAPTVTRPVKQVYYRVEVFADNGRNAKAQASAKRRNMQSRFPQYPANLAFDAPFWRVRIGEFRSRGDAETAMAEIRSAFPSYTPYLRIVRD